MRGRRSEPLRSETALGTKNARRVVRFLLPYWKRLILILGTVSVAAALGIVPPLLVRAIVDDAIAVNNRGLLFALSLAMVGAALAIGLVGVLRSYLNTVVSQRIMYDLRVAMFSRLQSLSLSFFTKSRTGELMSRLTSDITGTDYVISGTLVSVFQNILILISTLATMLVLDWQLTLVSLLVLPWLILPTKTVGKLRQRLRFERQRQLGSVNSLMAESLGISGLMLIKTFNREKDVLDRFQRDNKDLMDLQVREALVGRWYFMLLFLVTTGGPAIVYYSGGIQVMTGAISLGTVLAVVALLARLYTPATDLMSLHVDVMTSAAYFERIFEYLDLEPDIADGPGAIDIGLVAGHIRLESVNLEYVPGKRALDSVDVDITAGTMIALVGPSGAGKTSLTYLIPRLYDPTAGRILLDGYDIRDLTLDSLRRQVGYVTQETFLFHTSVRENMLIARPDATEDEIRDACESASVMDVIDALPEGLDTIVGERGYRLSGGEKQRLAIARVLLKNPALLLLDEATASLDTHSERAVQRALRRLMHGRTTIVIAHRLSTVLAADVILYMDQGRIIESGSHTELLALDACYASLYQEQFLTPDPA